MRNVRVWLICPDLSVHRSNSDAVRVDFLSLLAFAGDQTATSATSKALFTLALKGVICSVLVKKTPFTPRGETPLEVAEVGVGAGCHASSNSPPGAKSLSFSMIASAWTQSRDALSAITRRYFCGVPWRFVSLTTLTGKPSLMPITFSI